MKQKIALIAHDRCKEAMIALAQSHAPILLQWPLVATATTGALLRDRAGLAHISLMRSGPEGGDLQIGALIATDEIAAVIFLRDVRTAQPHEPDIAALLRVCDAHNIPLATNLASAEILLHALAK